MNDRFGKHVGVSIDGHVAIVTLDRPPHNFATIECVGEIADAFQAADAEPVVRAILLRSQGKTFCAGAELSADDRPARDASQPNPLYEQAARLFRVEKPVIAAIQGSAVGAGLGLACVADFRVASPEARFTANFVKLGFHPGFGLTYVLPRIIGAQRANLMVLSGRRIKAEEALAWGLVDQIAPPADLDAAALEFAHEIAANAPLAVRDTRATLRAGLADDVVRAMALENGLQLALGLTNDFREGIRAVTERRPGVFTGT